MHFLLNGYVLTQARIYNVVKEEQRVWVNSKCIIFTFKFIFYLVFYLIGNFDFFI